MKPYLLIDVDGVLNPGKYQSTHTVYNILGFTVQLNKEDGSRLLDLSKLYELVWATTWENLANIHIGQKIELPQLPYIEWSVRYPTYRDYETQVMVKTKEIMEWVKDRPFAWIDDDLKEPDLKLLSSIAQKHLALKIDSSIGITNENFRILLEWGKE